jgi:glycosyltransferase involved in cell wall biosynthesis
VNCHCKEISILYIASTLARIGPNKGLYNIIKHIDKERYKPTILTLSPESAESMLPCFEQLGVPVYSLNLDRILGGILGRFSVRRFVYAHNPDLIQPHGFRAEMFSWSLLSNYPFITVIRNQYKVDFEMSYGKLLGGYMAWRRKRYLRQIPNQVIVSKNLMKDRNNNLHIFPIPNGVDTDVYFPLSQNERLGLRKKLGLPADKRIYTYVGRLVNGKDPLTLIRGFISSRAAENGILLLIGSGPLEKRCKAVAANTNGVIFTGMVQNVEAYLRASDIYVSASLTEGLPNSVIEAMACGLGVCLSNIEAHEEILELDKTAGVTFEMKNAESLAAALDGISSESLEDISAAAVNVINNYFDAETMSRKYQQAYQKILDESQ